jgi:hypothetical protein
MRRPLRLAVVVVVLAWTGPTWAQRAVTWGAPAGPVVNQVIDTNQAAAQSNSFSWGGMFSKLNPFKKKPAPATNLPKRPPTPNPNASPPLRVLP